MNDLSQSKQSHAWVGVFTREEDALAAIGTCRQGGFDVLEVFTPYPLEAAPEALGRRPTRIPLVCLLLGLCGLLGALGFQFWASDASWNLNVGGKPDNSIWAFIPVTFEATVLAAAVGTVIVFMMRCLLFPGVHAQLPDPRVVDDAFALVVQDPSDEERADQLEQILAPHHPESFSRFTMSDAPRLPGGLLAGFIVVAIIWAALMHATEITFARDSQHRPHEWGTEMVYSQSFGPFEPNPNFEDQRTLRPPLAGSIARGNLPLDFPLTKEGAQAAGKLLINPYAQDPPGVRERGRMIFEIFCTVCHGAKGLGDGIMISKGIPAPPSLLDDDARKMKDGEMYFTLTRGRGGMPAHAFQLSSTDRWKVLRHIRQLQEAAK